MNERKEMQVFEVLEWRQKRYQFFKRMCGTEEQVWRYVDQLNDGYTGPRYVFRPVEQ